MKVTSFILSLLICVSLTSCSKWDPVPNYFTGYFYINFINSEGENLAIGLETNGDSQTEISIFEYNYRMFFDEKEVIRAPNHDPSISICSNDPKYLNFAFGLSPSSKNTVAYQLVCPHIFGNGEANAITTIWSTPATSGEETATLVDLQFNGKSIPLESEDGYKHHYKIMVE